MQRQKTVAVMVTMIMSSTATAYALNVGVINATRPKPAVASAVDVEPAVTTVIVEVPYDSGPPPSGQVAVPSPVVALTATSNPAPATAQNPTLAPPVSPPAAFVKVVEPVVPTVSPAATTYETFSAGPAGTVVLAHTDSTIDFWAAYTANGWNYQVENSAGREIVVKYRRDGSEMTFVAKLKGSQIVSLVEGPGGGQDD